MICPKCQKENPGNARFCENCGNPLQATQSQPVSSPTTLIQQSPVSQPTNNKKFLLIGVALILLLLVLGGIRLTLSSIKNIKTVANQNLTSIPSTIPTSPTSSTSYCQSLYQDLLKKYGKEYNSCLTSVNVSITQCQKPSGVGGDFKQNLNIILILDDSGSMAENVSGGQKITVAKNVITNFVNSLPASAKVGLMVYGNHGSNYSSDKAISCAGIDMVYPLSTLDKNAFISAVNSFQPTGWTPIAGALNKAQSILAAFDPSTNSNLIYLVTDGIETCDGNPVTAARQLNQSNAKAIVNIVGFNVDNTAQAQLQQAAQAGGGQYYYANSADDMSKVFNDQEKLLQQYNAYWLCNVQQSNSIWLDLTTNQNQIWLCMTEKRNKEWLDITTEMNRWPYKDPKSECRKYINEQVTKKGRDIQKWGDDIFNKIQQKKDINMDQLKNELNQVTNQYNSSKQK